MLSLDQVRLLENHVEKAVSKITSLTSENEHLRSQLSTLQARVVELEGFVRGFKDDQGKIEAGILNALEQLGALENTITGEDDESPAGEITPSDTVDSVEPAEEEAGTPTNTIIQDIENNEEAASSDENDGQIDIF